MNHEQFLSSLQHLLAIDDPEQALALIAEAPDELLSGDTLAEMDRLLAAETDEGRRAFLAERRDLLQNLRALRQQFGELQEQIEALPEAERRFLSFMAIPNSLGIAALIANSDDATLNELQATLTARLAETDDEQAAGIRARLDDLADLRGAAGREAAQARLDAAQAAINRLGGDLVAWIQTPDWGTSESYLREHAADLLTDDGERALDLLQLANPGNDDIPTHRQLLQFARQQGIEAAYAQLRRELGQMEELEEPGQLEELREAARQMAESPLWQAIAEFVSVEDDGAARSLLANRSNVLLTTDARGMLEQWTAVARQRGDAAVQARLEARLALWNEAWRGRAVGPLRPQADEMPEVAQPWQERQPADQRGDRILVIGSHNSVVMPGGKLLNIVNVGELALQWRRPLETQPGRARGAVGREEDLAKLHARLLAQGGAALVGKGAATAAPGRAAVRGQPGIGKTVLAAMYATRYADDFPGGVLWLEIGPSKRSEADVAGDLQKLAAYAYADPVQAGEMLSRCELTPEVVQTLLSGHGRLLVVLDDVWKEGVVSRLKAALPAEACVLLTTRDYDVAYALEESAQGIQPLDVLTADDARLLLQSKAPGLDADLANQVAQGLGCHAQALGLAAAALARQAELGQSHQKTAAELLKRVHEGRGFGDLPRMDKENAITAVEIAYRYSYDYLGEDNAQGLARQAWLRGLGAFAQEADFDAAATAAIWGVTQARAQGFLELLAGLALIQTSGPGGRWQQHAILRAYALSLQDQAERLVLAESHADYYVHLTRACYRQVPRDNERIELEFKQIEHAFDWCVIHSPQRAVALYEALSDFMTVRGRSQQAMQWGETALAAANRVGARLGTANTLQSLGDLESRLGNIDQARQHYDDALPLYQAEQDRLGTANTLKSLGDLESRLGNIDQARQHYDDALPLYQAEQDRLGTANTLKSLGDLERRLGNIDQARQHYDDALPLYQAEQARLGTANTLQSLGDLERRLGNIDQARQHYDDALPLYQAEQDRLGTANTLKSLGDLERRLGNIDQARQHYDDALPLYQAEQARLGTANTLQSLGDLERRLGNIDQARQHYDDALPLYQAEQARLGTANTLQSLGDLERRLGNIDQARQHYDDALPLYQAEQARLGTANTLKSLGDLESRLGNIDQARQHYDDALPLYQAEQARLGTANTLKSLGDLERRLGNIDQARQHYDDALPLYQAEQDRLGTANTLKSLGDLESRLGNIDQARQHYDDALPLYQAEQARLGTANTLKSLGDLERRLGNIDQARQHYDDALPLYQAEQARLGTANTLQSLGDLERRLGNIDQARQHYDDALPLYQAEQDRLGTANTLQSLGDLERRLGNIDQARQHYDDALPLYQAEQARLGTANTLKSLGDLERRLGNIDQARQHYDDALPLYQAEQARLGTANTLQSLGDLERRLGNIDQARQHYDDALPLYQAEQDRLGTANTLKSLGDLESRLGNIDQARQHYDDALRLFRLEQEPGGIINTLVSQARLEAGEGNINRAKGLYQQAFQVADQTGFAEHPIVRGMRQEHAALEGLAQLQDDPLAAGLTALMRADSDRSLVQALDDHPILAEAEALFALAGLINEALKEQQGETVTRLALFLALLLERYNHAHSEQIDLETHQAVIDLCEQVVPLTEAVNIDLDTMFRQQAGWACNTLGNHYADVAKDLAQAVAAYTRGLDFDPTNAMLLRNRAGVHLDRREAAAARAGIEAAAALEPDAPRLAKLKTQLEELEEEGTCQ